MNTKPFMSSGKDNTRRLSNEEQLQQHLSYL